MMRPNSSFKPNLLRYSKSVAGKACHTKASTTQVGLTQVLGGRVSDWILAAIGFGAVWIVSIYLSRLVKRRTGRSPELSWHGRSLVGLGTAICILLAGATLQIRLPWLAFVAGSSAACISIALQPFFGKHAP
jgi:hypothetical protein